MVALCAAAAAPCSFDMTPAFSFRVRPDDPIAKYVGGRIGIIRPEYARSHLVVAYRWLSGNPPTAAEREGFTALLQHRLKETTEADQGKAWEQLRAEFRGVQPGSEPDTWRSAGNYTAFTNCTSEAFANAMAVLRDRAARFGAKSAAVASWLDAQETVFANCGDGEAIPKDADASLPAIIRADRAYQIAAAKFYAMRYDDARADFLAIANDKASPWRQTARIVAARALLRKATVPAENGFAREPLEQGERELRAILADASLAPLHAAARKLAHFAAFRLRPEERLKELAESLMRGSSDARGDLDEYTLLLDTQDGGDDDLTKWIRAFQSGKDATAQWKATKKLHWLAAAIAADSPSDVNALLEASSRIGPDSVAYPLIAHHRARLLLGAKKADAARAELDRALALDESKLPTSGRNLLLTQRRGLARSLADYLRDAQMMPVGLESEQTLETYEHPLLPPDAGAVMNESMPLEMLATIATSNDPHPTIVIAAWTRAILLGRTDVAARLAPLILQRQPNLQERYDAWRNAPASQRRFAAADLIVHFAGHDPNVQWGDAQVSLANEPGGGWWCFPLHSEPHAVPPFLDQEPAASEQLALRELGAGATWILRAFLDLANAQPQDPRVAEGLSLAVKGTRHSCGDRETDALAEKAFNVLHKRYAKTAWAKETKYWYRAGY